LFIGILMSAPVAADNIAQSGQEALIKKLQEDHRPKDPRNAFEAEVIKVKDGDSIIIKDQEAGKEEELRLFGVDAPEKDQAFGLQSRQFSAEQVQDKKITVVPFYKDKLKRTVAVVICGDGELLENKLVRAGLAWWYDRYDPHNTQLEIMQKQAQAHKVGLWAGDKPVKPEDYRRNQFAAGKWKVIDGVLYMTKDGRLVPEDEY
jgi:micrococcal nuclease